VPGATPLPRRPFTLVLGSPAELLASPGCPVCRYVAEADEQYLAWFALEGHADSAGVTRLCASLGMCPRHTRTLMSQPGAPIRLTAVYVYVIREARRHLSTGKMRLEPCPMCEHSEASAGRALDILLDGLTEAPVRNRYLELGGLCVPHLRAAAMRGRRQVVTWLVRAARDSAGASAPSLAQLAGGPDRDAEVRALLRVRLPSAGSDPLGACPVCFATARREHDELARLGSPGRLPHLAGTGQLPDGFRLCGWHLRDAVLAGANPALVTSAGQAARAALERLPSRWPAWMRTRGGQQAAEACLVCTAREQAAGHELVQCRAILRELPTGQAGGVALCVRDVLRLRAADAAAGQVAAGLAARRADTLLGELNEAFLASTWAHRREPRGPETTAWKGAVGFLDGQVFGGCPPPDLRGPGSLYLIDQAGPASAGRGDSDGS
jgi:hypothetical protein